MIIIQLRAKHPRFIYKSYEIDKNVISFNFILEPDIEFQPQITLPEEKELSPWLVFNLGMVEAISYWKAACSPDLKVEAGSLTKKQMAWWHDLFIKGLGEFFYKNNIDFAQPNFLTIKSSSQQQFNNVTMKRFSGNLILASGGKDSCVTIELLKNEPGPKNVLLLNPTPAALKVVEIAGYKNPIIVKRTIDPKLIELNNSGYLNGHTPFSAYLAFLGVLLADAYGFASVVASNEKSASQGNVVFHGMEINHQYSKSLEFEKKFREYVKTPHYYSLLRPYTELAVAEKFAALPQYHKIFSSCNINRGLGWCGGCAKCAFVYLALSPYLPTDKMTAVFGSDFFEKPELRRHFLDLAGMGNHKPFECVGTPEETRRAITLTIEKYKKEERAIPHVLYDCIR